MTIVAAATRPEFSDVLNAVITRRGYSVLSMEALDAAAAEEPLMMLFLAGDHWRLAESDDVAAILPELDQALGGHARIVVATRDDERALQRRYRFTAFPALVFLRDGQYLGVIEGMKDWSDYLVDIPDILGREPSDPPAYQLPAGCSGTH